MKNVISIALCVLVLVFGVSVLLGGTYFQARENNSRDARELIAAIRNDDTAIIHEILQRNPNCVNAPSSARPSFWLTLVEIPVQYPLTVACLYGNVDTIQLLIDAGADVNGHNDDIPLRVVYMTKNQYWYDVSLVLIQNGASLNYSIHPWNNHVYTLSDIVDGYCRTETDSPISEEEVMASFTYALEHCDRNRIDWSFTLCSVAETEYTEIMRILLDGRYCEVNEPYDGTTALISASRYSTTEMVQCLLQYGADINFVDDQGKTAYDYAMENGNAEMASLLKIR